MSQATPTIGPNKSGLAYRQEDNDGKTALLNHHKGSSAPSYAEAGTIWIDDTDTPWLMKAHDGTDWITLSAINAAANTFSAYHGSAPLRLQNHASDTGSANTYAVAPAPALTTYATGTIVSLKPAHANTGASTLAVSGLSAKNIKLSDGTNPPANALITTGVYFLIYDGTNFVLTNPSTAGNTDKFIAYAQSSTNTQTSYTTPVIPADNSLPQNTEGTEVLTVTDTTTTSTQVIDISGVWQAALSSSTAYIMTALFVNSTANAVYSNFFYFANANRGSHMPFHHVHAPGAAGTYTIKLRIGVDNGTLYFNRPQASSDLHGGSLRSSLTAKVIEP